MLLAIGRIRNLHPLAYTHAGQTPKTPYNHFDYKAFLFPRLPQGQPKLITQPVITAGSATHNHIFGKCGCDILQIHHFSIPAKLVLGKAISLGHPPDHVKQTERIIIICNSQDLI